MKELIESKWSEIIDTLVKQHDISDVAVKTWILPLQIHSIKDDTITFYVVQGARGIEFIKHKYYDFFLSMAIEQIVGKKFVQFLFDFPNNCSRRFRIVSVGILQGVDNQQIFKECL